MNCNKCGHMLPDDSEFCQYCGSKVEKVAEEQEFKAKESEKSINEDVVVSHENLVITKVKPSKIENSNRIKKEYKKSKFVSFCNISNIALTSISIVSIIIAMIVQDPRRAIKEYCDPTIIYFIMLCVLGCYLGLSINSLVKCKYKLISCLSPVMTFSTVWIAVCGDGAVHSTQFYDELLLEWTYYNNYEIVAICDVIWAGCMILINIIPILYLCKAFISVIRDNYYSSLKYREKCYIKVAKMQSYLEKGIITKEEYEKNKKDILKRIKTEANNNSTKTEIANTKKIDEDKTIPNGEEATKSLDTKKPALLVRDDVFREKAETVKVGKLSNEEWGYFYKTDFEKFWEMVIEEYDLSKLPDSIVNLRDDTMIYGEDARKVYLSRLRGVVGYNEWTTKNRPEVINIRWDTLKELRKELQEKTSDKVYMLDVIRKYEDKYIRY